jgi:hypothetical protein
MQMGKAAKVAKSPRQQHTVPRTYLEGFCLPGADQIAVLDLHTGEIRMQRPVKVMRRRDYFRQRHAPEGADEFVLERGKATRWEGQLKTIIGKLCLGGHDLTEDELIAFVQHIEFQHLTVPRQAKFLKSAVETFITNFALTIPEVAEGLRRGLWKIKMKDEFRFTSLRNIVKSGKFFTYICRMVWDVWGAPDGYAFITSDNPVTIYNTDMHASEVAGIGLLGSSLLYPLTPRHCLELFHPEIVSQGEIDPLQPVEVEPFDIKGVRIRAGRTMPPDLAYATNCLQGLHAERYLAGNSVHILEEIHESLKTGKPRPNKATDSDQE